MTTSFSRSVHLYQDILSDGESFALFWENAMPDEMNAVMQVLIEAGVPAEMLSKDGESVLYKGEKHTLCLRPPSEHSSKAVCKLIRCNADGSVVIVSAFIVKNGDTDSYWIIDALNPSIRYVLYGTPQDLVRAAIHIMDRKIT